MKNLTIAIRVLFLLATVIMLSSWGDTGHSMISFRINLSFNQEMSRFNDWVFYLSDHASDADKRKRDDPSEGPKHYIDIDNYSGFVENGTIPHALEDCISEYGAGFVEENGFLPWATLAMYDSVVHCMRREDWGNAKKYAADLGHYVADGHMPMHLTRNYDGQFTGNKGIHARYEIDMIARYHDKIVYEGTPASSIDDPLAYIFDYIYRNYKYMDSILVADDYASEMGNGTTSEQYYMALWERTEHLTRTLFSNASHAIAVLLYSAWNEAGRPGEDVAGVPLPAPGNTLYGLRISPNPVETSATISYFNQTGSQLTATVFDASGRSAVMLDGFSAAPGHHTREWFPGHLPGGNYYLVLQSANRRVCEPFTLLD
jgi:hypothetical protein